MKNIADPKNLLPHTGKMNKIEQILTYAPGEIECLLRPSSESVPQGVGSEICAAVGVEYMAQACGCLGGLSAGKSDEPGEGMLISVRKLESKIAHFLPGEELVAGAKSLSGHGNVYQFYSYIRKKSEDTLLMSANISILKTK